MRKFIDTMYKTRGRKLWSWYFTIFTAYNIAVAVNYAFTGKIWIANAVIGVCFLVIFVMYYRLCLRQDALEAVAAASNPFHGGEGTLDGVVQDGAFIHDDGIIPLVEPEDADSPQIWAMMQAMKTGNAVSIYQGKDGVWRNRDTDEPLPDNAQGGRR